MSQPPAVSHPGPGAPGQNATRPPVAGAIVALVLGIVLTLASAGPLLAGLVLATVGSIQNSEGFLLSPGGLVQSTGSAILSPELDLSMSGQQPVAGELATTLTIVATPAEPGDTVFIGLAPRAAVQLYLAGASYSEINDVEVDPFRVDYIDTVGQTVPAPPGGEGFWISSDSSSTQASITTSALAGDTTVVIMNADGSAGVGADVRVGFRSAVLLPVGIWLMVIGVVFLAVGIALTVIGATGIGRRNRGAQPPTGFAGGGGAVPEGTAGSSPDAVGRAAHPVELTGTLGAGPSRWLWLVKWILLIPHLVVLFFLWIAFFATSVVAWFAILFTGRYPRGIFEFNVGVLRWSWRVAFYGYSVLGTDEYPPFSFAPADYPATLTIAYPERLSRGLVLVKSWLLALPHLIVIGAITSNHSTLWTWSGTRGAWDGARQGTYSWGTGISVVGALVAVAAIVLLVSGRYPRPLFDLLMGIQRWCYRVVAYVALLRDDYPPFRLDQGPVEPSRESARQ